MSPVFIHILKFITGSSRTSAAGRKRICNVESGRGRGRRKLRSEKVIEIWGTCVKVVLIRYKHTFFMFGNRQMIRKGGAEGYVRRCLTKPHPISTNLNQSLFLY